MRNPHSRNTFIGYALYTPRCAIVAVVVIVIVITVIVIAQTEPEQRILRKPDDA